jgi:multiple sugar transport system ATP-binding protein
VLVGVRPEALRLAPEGGEAALRGTVVGIEPLGAETLLMVALDGGAGELTARLHRETAVDLGAAVALAAEPSALYLFDAASGLAIAPGALALAA